MQMTSLVMKQPLHAINVSPNSEKFWWSFDDGIRNFHLRKLVPEPIWNSFYHRIVDLLAMKLEMF